MVIKWRFFRHLLGSYDADAERCYIWHIEARIGPRMKAGLATDQWKRTIHDYVNSAKTLLDSMQQFGFLQTEPIPIDINGELFGGAHRLACAIALKHDLVPVVQIPHAVWAPPWNEAWFEEHGMTQCDLQAVREDFEEIQSWCET